MKNHRNAKTILFGAGILLTLNAFAQTKWNTPANIPTNTNDAYNSNVELGSTITIEKLDVTGNISANKMIVPRITSSTNILHFGDSSIIMDMNTNNIYPDKVSGKGYMGLGVGTLGLIPLAQGSVSIGFVSETNANYSSTLGAYLQTDPSAFGSIVIGRGISPVQKLINTLPNSLMLGFGSDVPTLFVSPASGAGTSGNVGIGTSSPNARLSINVENNASKGFTIYNKNTNKEVFSIYGDGSVAVGSPKSLPVGYKLYVTGGILTERCRVALDGTNDWADYVFDEKYPLMAMGQLEIYIQKNQHLPNVPSAQELSLHGIDVSKMFSTLLEKIEENTLYSIQLKKENEKLKKEIEAIKQKIK